MERDSRHHERDAGELASCRKLPKHEHTDHDGNRREQRHEERIGRTGQTGHRPLIEHVRDHR